MTAPPDDAGFPALSHPPVALPRPRWTLLNQLEKTAIGVRSPDGTVTVNRGEAEGCLLYGPYWHFPAGRYRLEFRCGAAQVRLRGQPVVGVEVIVLGRFQRAWRDFTVAELARGSSLEFTIPPELGIEAGNESRFEFRFFHLGNADLWILSVELQELPPDAPIIVPEREWRLLGRLRHGWIGRRDRAGLVRVRRGEPPGLVLYGGWPYLRLGRGGYRLTVGCTEIAAGPPGKPVFAAEIRGQSWWHRGGRWRRLMRRPSEGGVVMAQRDFTRGEAGAGQLSVDFAVPTDFGLESGGDGPFDIRLRHLGGGGLTITAVDLRPLPAPAEEGESASASVPEFPLTRIAGRKKLVLIGNCQCRVLAQAFNHSDALNTRFEAKYHFIPLPANLQEFAIRDLEACDVLLVQDIHLWDDSPLRAHVNPHAEVIRFPFARFASLWPFDGWNGPTDRDAIGREAPNMTFPFLDGMLAKLRRQIPDPEQRFAAYRDLQLPGVLNYRRLHDLETRRLLGIDKKYGMRLGEFTLENFRQQQIFHTTVRPNWQGFNLLVRYILGALGIAAADPIARRSDTTMRDPQVPVHPKVARDLGVTWADEQTRYMYQGHWVTWEAYVRRYIAHYG